MKKWPLISSVIQLCIGLASVAAYIIIGVNGEPLGKWTVTLLLALAFVTLGAIGIGDWVKENKNRPPQKP